MTKKIKVIILNDTRRNYGHIGCEEVMNNIFHLCDKFKLNIIHSFTNTDLENNKDYDRFLKIADAVIINGEGTMHDNSSGCINLINAAEKAKSQGVLCYLINTVWQNNSFQKLNELFNLIFVRESLSQIELKNHGYSSVVVPDLSLYDREENRKEQEKKELSKLIVVDSVRWNITSRLARFSAKNKYSFYYMDKLIKKTRLIRLYIFLFKSLSRPKILSINDLKSSRFILTGRFHALCLAMKYGVPFICINSNTHKMQGMLQDCGLDTSKYTSNLEEINNLNLENLNFSLEDKLKIKYFIDNSQVKIENMFLTIYDDIMKHDKILKNCPPPHSSSKHNKSTDTASSVVA